MSRGSSDSSVDFAARGTADDAGGRLGRKDSEIASSAGASARRTGSRHRRTRSAGAVGDAEGRQTIGVELSAVGVDRRLGVADLDDARRSALARGITPATTESMETAIRFRIGNRWAINCPIFIQRGRQRWPARTPSPRRAGHDGDSGSSAVCQRPICKATVNRSVLFVVNAGARSALADARITR